MICAAAAFTKINAAATAQGIDAYFMQGMS
jgi:hypothetical protein